MGDIVSEARSMKPSTTWNRARVNEMADEIERLRDSRERLHRWLDTNEKAYARLEAKLQRAEAVIERIAGHTICQGRSVWGCMDMIRDEIRAYDKERDDDVQDAHPKKGFKHCE